MARWIVEDDDEFYCSNCGSVYGLAPIAGNGRDPRKMLKCPACGANITSVIRLTFDEDCRKKETLYEPDTKIYSK